MNVILTTIDLNFDSTNVKPGRQTNSVCSMIMRSENATLQDSNIIKLNLSHDCDKQECQDVFSMKQKHFSIRDLKHEHDQCECECCMKDKS